MSKQTSVVFLWEQLKQWLPQNYTVDDSVKMLSILNKAVAMHKDETCELAFKVGRGQDYDDEQVRELAEIYYNETFGGNHE
jgi:hypothetical protein